MKKVKVKAKNLILIFWDEEQNEPRKVLLGDPEELMLLLEGAYGQTMKRLTQMFLDNAQSKADLKESVLRTQPKGVKLNNMDTFDGDESIEVTYRIVK